MLKVFARLVRNTVQMQIREVAADPRHEVFTTSSLTGGRLCIHPVSREGKESMCGKPVHTSGNHGWYCRFHYIRSLVLTQTNDATAAEKADADNILFICGSDKKRGEAVKLGPFKGLLPPIFKPSIHDPYELIGNQLIEHHG